MKSTKTRDKIREAAIANGWTIRARVGERHNYGRGGTHDSDIFHIGSVDRHLVDGTPVTEPEHSVRVWYTYAGAVRSVSGHTFTVPDVIYHEGIGTTRHEKDKAERVIAALVGRTGDIPSYLPAQAYWEAKAEARKAVGNI